MNWTAHQRAERAARLVDAAAAIATEAARILRESGEFAQHSAVVNQLSAHLAARAKVVRADVKRSADRQRIAGAFDLDD